MPDSKLDLVKDPAQPLLERIVRIHSVRRLSGPGIDTHASDGTQANSGQWLLSLNLLSKWLGAPVCLVDNKLTVVRGSDSLAAKLQWQVGDGAGGKLGAIVGMANLAVLTPYLERACDGEHIILEVAHAPLEKNSRFSLIELRSVNLPTGPGVILVFRLDAEVPSKLSGVESKVASSSNAKPAHSALETELFDVPYARLDRNGSLLAFNSAFAAFFGIKKESAASLDLKTLLPEAEFEKIEGLLSSASDGHSRELECQLTTASKQRCWIEARVTPNEEGAYLLLKDVDIKRRQGEAFRQANELISTQLERSGLASFTLDHKLDVTHWSSNAERLFGWQREEVLLQPLVKLKLLAPEAIGEFSQRDEISFATTGGTHRFLAHATNRSNRRFPSEWQIAVLRDTLGKVASIHVLVEDVSETEVPKDQTEAELNLDSLTKLPNRSMYEFVMRMQIDRARRRIGGVAVLFLDLDQFKTVNDTLGHRIGDLLLIAVADVLRESVEAEDSIVRLGGDEFMIISAQMQPKSGAHSLAERIIKRLRDPLPVDRHHLSVGGSIGIAVYPDHGIDPDTLLRNADLAMYHAKVSGRNRFEFFSPALAQRNKRRLGIKNALSRAIKDDALVLYYQPRVSFKDDSIVGAEALLRWNDSQLGSVAPKEFVGIAEDSGLIHELGLFVFQKACRQVRQWQDRGVPCGIVAVNFSAQQLYTSTFLHQIRDILESTACDASVLEVEITETSMLADMTVLIPVVAELKSLGMRIAIDDFGTGFSSLSHLQRLEVDTLKIDHSFIRGMMEKSGDLAITRSVISLGRSLNLTVTAEGVENDRQLETLHKAGCDYYQGFLFSPAVGPDDYEMLVREPPPKGSGAKRMPRAA